MHAMITLEFNHNQLKSFNEGIGQMKNVNNLLF